MDSPIRTLACRGAKLYAGSARILDRLQPWLALGIRLYLARVFVLSGLTKLRDWDVTETLFENDYHVPLLSPEVAAYMGTAAELTLPVLLAAGVLSRFTALALFVFNAVAAASYPDISPAGVKDHILWGALMIVIVVYGPGALAVDRWIVGREKV